MSIASPVLQTNIDPFEYLPKEISRGIIFASVSTPTLASKVPRVSKTWNNHVKSNEISNVWKKKYENENTQPVNEKLDDMHVEITEREILCKGALADTFKTRLKAECLSPKERLVFVGSIVAGMLAAGLIGFFIFHTAGLGLIPFVLIGLFSGAMGGSALKFCNYMYKETRSEEKQTKLQEQRLDINHSYRKYRRSYSGLTQDIENTNPYYLYQIRKKRLEMVREAQAELQSVSLSN
ncbi:MAG TPA: AtpZ/AtpI family protein [Rhabdochlamydiaceae bacterium]|nr:AtpZ/AtpI family protein [Rhabdochlamydiaceae bacterium]